MSDDIGKNKTVETTGTTNGSSAGPAGFRSQAGMTVERPRQEDLQASYASIVGNDANPKGWYGSMSMFIPPPLPF